MNTMIIGATGYGGAELIRLIMHHPYLDLNCLISSSKAGESLREIYPHLNHLSYIFEELNLEDIDQQGDLVFFATPPGISSQLAPSFIERGKVVIDLSGDFRLHTEKKYEQWYQKKSADQTWLNQAVYGLSEWFQPEIAKADLISNPGCYPTATLLALLPLLKAGVIATSSLIIDAKSGMTGAGRSTKQGLLYSEMNDNLRPYKATDHQHIPEIEQFATQLAEENVKVSFVPHLVPMNRGILVTIYTDLLKDYTYKEISEIYQDAYLNSSFVRMMSDGIPETKQVQGSNYCDIGFQLDQRTGKLIIFAVIDNLMKGAAGQAIQNANIRMGYEEETGLLYSPLFP